MEEEGDRKGFDLGLMVRLLAYLRPYWTWVLLTLMLICCASAVSQASPYLTKIAVDEYIGPKDIQGLNGLVLIFVSLLIIQLGISYAQRWTTSMIGQWAMRDVRTQIFSHFQRLPLRFFDRTPIGRLMARNTNDVDALNELFTDGIVSICSDIFTIIAILGYIFYMDIDLGLLTTTILPFLAAITIWLQRKTFWAFRLARTRFARFSAYLQESLSGMEVVQLFGNERRSAHRFGEANNAYLSARLESTLYHSLYFPSMEFGGSVLLALVLWQGSNQIIQGQMEWGILVAMLQYVPRFFMPIRDISERYATLQVAMASAERIFELLDSEPEIIGGSFQKDHLDGEIEFRNVWFAYQNEEWVLRDVSFRVSPGHSLALVGTTGAGKSTIINLICRFYTIQRGTILIDGVDILQWNIEALRQRVGIVPQDVFLFAGNIAQNISLNDSTISPEQIQQAARAVNADRFIERLPNAYQQLVNERGTSLSVGQQQLLSFARALAVQPDILVLDEATANIDTETETWIQQAVATLMQERTSILIAHRLSTIRHANEILVLHQGEIRESGSHETLLSQGGIYYHLHQLQYADKSSD